MTLTIAALPRHATHPCSLKLQGIRSVLGKKSCWRMNPDATLKECHSVKTSLTAICREPKLLAPVQPCSSINRLPRRSQRCAIGLHLTISDLHKVVTTIISSIITTRRHFRRLPPWFKRVCSQKFRRRLSQRGTKIGERQPKLCSWWQTCAHQQAPARI